MWPSFRVYLPEAATTGGPAPILNPPTIQTPTIWGGPSAIANAAFDLATALRTSIERSEAFYASEEADQIFSLSPFTSPEITPPSSPQLAAVNLPNHPAMPGGGMPSYDWFFSLSPCTSPESTPPSSPKLFSAPACSIPTLCPPTEAPPMTSKEKRKAMKKKSSRERRNRKRAEAQQATYAGYIVNERLEARHVKGSVPIYLPHLDASASENVASTGFVGLDDNSRSQKRYTLEELVGLDSKFKFKLQHWDGRTPVPIVDSKGRLIGILAGHPKDDSWPILHQQACERLTTLRPSCTTPKGKRKHRRGAFVALRCGVSHGGGQKKPSNLGNTASNQRVLDELNAHPAFQRIAGFASGVMATWAPKLYRYYQEKLGALHAHDPDLVHIFDGSVFSATTYNLGPRTVCFKHTDFGNLPFGLCAVTALGSYDPTKGGHLVLWECKLVIEFPPGSTILIASGLIAHSNIDVAKHETRFSVVQYSAGALFRWVDNGFQKSVDYLKSLSPEELVKVGEKNAERWALGLSLLPTFVKPS